MKHSLTEQRETSTAIALPLDELELVDETFHLPVGIDQGKWRG
jgi:hypothetical protein